MSDGTAIEWTDATWNPIRALGGSPDGPARWGWHCEHASPGCANCYAERINRRLGTGFAYKPGNLSRPGRYPGDLRRGDVSVFLDKAALLKPLRWRKPRQVFVCSMTDLFAGFVPDELIDRVFAVMALCPQHTFQVLTKRPARMRGWMANPETPARIWAAVDDLIDRWDRGDVKCRLVVFDGDPKLPALAAHGASWGGELPWPLRNVWLGVSAEDQQRADERIPHLLATPAAIHFISMEPLLGPVDLTDVAGKVPEYGTAKAHGIDVLTPYNLSIRPHQIDWVIVGGESGPGARPMHPDWARSLRDQCADAGVPFFFKQWGAWGRDPIHEHAAHGFGREDRAACACLTPTGWRYARDWIEMPGELASGHGEWMFRLGKKAAGRRLDGVVHDGMPA